MVGWGYEYDRDERRGSEGGVARGVGGSIKVGAGDSWCAGGVLRVMLLFSIFAGKFAGVGLCGADVYTGVSADGADGDSIFYLSFYDRDEGICAGGGDKGKEADWRG